MRCPYCNTENSPQARYCKKCDRPLTPEQGFWTYKDKDKIISHTISSEELYKRFENGTIKKNTMVKEEGSSEWIPFRETDMYQEWKEEHPSTFSIDRNWYVVLAIVVLIAAAGFIWWTSQPEIREEPTFETNYQDASASLVTNGWVLSDTQVPDFQMIPIPVKDIGYIVKVQGKYGVINVDCDYLVQPEYDDLTIDGSVAGHTVLYKNEDGKNTGYTLEYLLGMTDQNDVQPTRSYPEVSINLTKNVNMGDATREDFDSPITIQLNNMADSLFNGGEKYYIWNPANDSAYGPYSIQELAYFTLDETVPEASAAVPGLFYTEKNGEYTVHSAGGTSYTTQSFQWAKPVSDEYMLVANNGQLASIDSNLNATFIGQVEAASAPVTGVDFVEIDGKWYRIYNYDYHGAVTLDQLKGTENKDDEQNGEENQNEEETEAVPYVLNSNMYIRSAPGGSVVTIAHVGTVVNVVSTEDDNGTVWGQIEDGNWVCISDNGYQFATKQE